MYTKMLTSKMGGELVSFKLDGEERVHQGLRLCRRKWKSILEKTLASAFPCCR